MVLLKDIKLVTFDITNTLLKFRNSPAMQYGEIGAMYGVLSDRNTLNSKFKKSWDRMTKEHPIFGLNTGIGWQQWWKHIVKDTLNESHLKLNDAKLNAITEHLLDFYRTSSAWQHCDGAIDLLQYIQSKGIRLGVISNFDPRLEEILLNTKLRLFFDFIVTSYASGVEKPDAAIFKKAMEASKIANLEPRNCLHIGDNVRLDYLGARNSAWHGILVKDVSVNLLVKSNPDVVIDSKCLYPSLYQFHSHLKNMEIW